MSLAIATIIDLIKGWWPKESFNISPRLSENSLILNLFLTLSHSIVLEKSALKALLILVVYCIDQLFFYANFINVLVCNLSRYFGFTLIKHLICFIITRVFQIR